MTNEEKRKLYAALSAPFSEDAIQRTEGRVTGRGYDTSGIGYQFIANRMNEVLGVGGWRTEQEISVREITTAKGRAAFDATCDVKIQFGEWVDGKFTPWAEAFSTGGHQSVSEADARKGAFTNGLKKAAAMLGCGKQAYEGTLDDDNAPAEETHYAPPPSRPPVQQKPQPQTQQPAPQTAQPAPQPIAQPQREQSHQTAPSLEQQPTATNVATSRNRLTSKQLAAIWALARKLNYAQQDFRREVKSRHGVQVEFLDKTTASTIIGNLSTRASNGHSHPVGDHGAEA